MVAQRGTQKRRINSRRTAARDAAARLGARADAGRRTRYPYTVEELPSGKVVRLESLAAAATFQRRTGRDPFSDPELLTVRLLLAHALDLEWKAVRGQGKRTRVLADKSVPGGVREEDAGGSAGRPSLHPELVTAVRVLVEAVGPTDAGMAMLLWGLDSSKAFPVGLSTIERGQWHRDVRVLIERLKRRLSQIAA